MVKLKARQVAAQKFELEHLTAGFLNLKKTAKIHNRC